VTCTAAPPESWTISPPTTSTRWTSYAPSPPRSRRHQARHGSGRHPRSPAEDPERLLDVVPADNRTPYDVRAVLRCLVDASELQEFKQLNGETLVCAFAHLDGHPIGIVANNGILFSESALKGADFIELCDRRGIPLVSCRTSVASWSAAPTRPVASPRTVPSW
jgi:acetyl-CoA carboxylase carboxyltransferase component